MDYLPHEQSCGAITLTERLGLRERHSVVPARRKLSVSHVEALSITVLQYLKACTSYLLGTMLGRVSVLPRARMHMLP
jgi:hypothetical protein